MQSNENGDTVPMTCGRCGTTTSFFCIGCRMPFCMSGKATVKRQDPGTYEMNLKDKKSEDEHKMYFHKSCYHHEHQRPYVRFISSARRPDYILNASKDFMRQFNINIEDLVQIHKGQGNK